MLEIYKMHSLCLNEFILTCLFVSLICTVLNYQNGLNLLLVSEVCWILLYSAYILVGLFFNGLTAYTISITILVFAAIDCSIWLLFLVYFFFYEIGVYNIKYFNIKYLFRSNRISQKNKQIK